MVEPEKEKIIVCENKPCITGHIKTECKSEVRSENVYKVLCVTAFLKVIEKTVEDKRIGYGGKITYYISYIDKDKKIKKTECGSEFKGELNGDVKKDSKVYLSLKEEKTSVSLENNYLTLSSVISIVGTVKNCTVKEVIRGGENLVVKEQEIPNEKSLGVCNGTYPLEEEFTLPYTVEEVLYQKITGVITGVNCGVGSVIVDGEAILSLIVLQNNDKRDIIKEERIFPFRQEIECEWAMPNMRAISHIEEKNFKTDINVDVDSGKSTFTVTAGFNLPSETFGVETLTVAEDVFSTENQLETEWENVNFESQEDIKSFTDKIYLRAGTEELPVGVSLIGTADEKVTITENNFSDGKITLTGIVESTLFFKDGQEVFTKKTEVPFEKAFESGISENSFYIKADLGKTNGRVVSLNEVELETELLLTVYTYKNTSYKLIKNIKVTGDKETDDTAISIFIPYKGEDLWSLAKRLNVCPDELVNTNKELNFPLSGEERIVVYRQK